MSTNGNGAVNRQTLIIIVGLLASVGIGGTGVYSVQDERQERKEAIAALDTTLQRETRLLDDRLLERITALDEKLQLELGSSLGSDLDRLTQEQRMRALEQENTAQRVEIQNLKERIAKLEALQD